MLRDLWLDTHFLLDPFHRPSFSFGPTDYRNSVIVTTEDVFRTALQCSTSWLRTTAIPNTAVMVLNDVAAKPFSIDLLDFVKRTIVIASTRLQLDQVTRCLRTRLTVEATPVVEFAIQQSRAHDNWAIDASTLILKHQVDDRTVEAALEYFCSDVKCTEIASNICPSVGVRSSVETGLRILVLCDFNYREAQELIKLPALSTRARWLPELSDDASLPYREDTLRSFSDKTCVLFSSLEKLLKDPPLPALPDIVLLLRPPGCPHNFLANYSAFLSRQEHLCSAVAQSERPGVVRPTMVLLYYLDDVRRVCALETAYATTGHKEERIVLPFCSLRLPGLGDDTWDTCKDSNIREDAGKNVLNRKFSRSTSNQDRDVVLLLHDPFKKQIGTVQNAARIVKAALGRVCSFSGHSVAETPRGFCVRLPASAAQVVVNYCADRTDLYVTETRVFPQSQNEPRPTQRNAHSGAEDAYDERANGETEDGRRSGKLQHQRPRKPAPPWRLRR